MTRMTAEQLAVIKRRLANTTGGNWFPADGIYIVDMENARYDGCGNYVGERHIAECTSADDAEFLGNAKWDVGLLIAEIERLNDEIRKRQEYLEYINEVEGFEYSIIAEGF